MPSLGTSESSCSSDHPRRATDPTGSGARPQWADDQGIAFNGPFQLDPQCLVGRRIVVVLVGDRSEGGLERTDGQVTQEDGTVADADYNVSG